MSSPWTQQETAEHDFSMAGNAAAGRSSFPGRF
jgi:hypothetical protein